MNRSRLAWIVGTKVALTLAVMLPVNRRTAVEFRALATLPGVRAGTPVLQNGQLIGRVVAKNRRGDTTALNVRFYRRAPRLSGTRFARVRWMGLNHEAALEIHTTVGATRPFAHGAWLEVLPPLEAPLHGPEVEEQSVERLHAAPLDQMPLLQLIPPATPRPHQAPPAST